MPNPNFAEHPIFLQPKKVGRVHKKEFAYGSLTFSFKPDSINLLALMPL